MGNIFPIKGTIQGIFVAAAMLMAIMASTGLLFAGPSPAQAQTLAENNAANSNFVTKQELQSAVTSINSNFVTKQELQSAVTSITSDIAGLKDAVSTLSSTVTSVARDLGTLTTSVTAIEDQLKIICTQVRCTS
jgi:septal ring factor EnvC (AmiA/AmiB activator)